jgi:hypothetical protein
MTKVTQNEKKLDSKCFVNLTKSVYMSNNATFYQANRL